MEQANNIAGGTTENGVQATVIQDKPKPAAILMREDIAEMVALKSKNIRSQVVSALADDEIAKRAEILTKAFRKRGEVANELKKISVPPKKFKFEGTKKIAVDDLFTPEAAAAVEKKAQELAKIDKAIEQALADEPNYEEIKKLFGSDNKPNQGGQSEEKSGEASA
jgi:hypothetical protein